MDIPGKTDNPKRRGKIFDNEFTLSKPQLKSVKHGLVDVRNGRVFSHKDVMTELKVWLSRVEHKKNGRPFERPLNP